MLIRISLIVAIIAGLAVGALNFTFIKQKITTLQTDLTQTKSDLDSTRADLSKTRTKLNSTETELTQTKKTLEDTTAAKAKAEADAVAANKHADQLTTELKTTKDNLLDTQQQLEAYKVSGYTPAQVASLAKTLKTTQDNLTESEILLRNKDKKIASLNAELSFYKTPEEQQRIALPANLTGKVLVSDPKWDFVVLNVGSDQEVVPYGQLLVNRNGNLVAKLRVTSVQKDRSIANVMPGWRLGDVMEGDQVIPAYPKQP